MSDEYTPTGPNWRDALSDLDLDWLNDDMAANDANFYGKEDADE